MNRPGNTPGRFERKRMILKRSGGVHEKMNNLNWSARAMRVDFDPMGL
jgi:hypothetical protein